MAELQDLQKRLSRFAGGPEYHADGALVVVKNEDDPALTMMREIEETYLPREVTFANDRGDFVSVLVSAGQVAMIMDSKIAELTPIDLIQTPLDARNSKHQTAVKALFSHFLDGVSEVVLRTAPHAFNWPSGLTPLAAQICFGPDILMEKGTALAPRLDKEAFLSKCQDVASAWIVANRSGEAIEEGPLERIQKLRHLAEKELKSLGSDLTAAQDCTCVILSSSSVGGDAILSGRSGDELIFVSLGNSQVAAVLNIWRACLIGQ